MKARINGVSAQVRKFDFLFGILLGEILLQHTDKLSWRLMIDTLAAVEMQTSLVLVESY